MNETEKQIVAWLIEVAGQQVSMGMSFEESNEFERAACLLRSGGYSLVIAAGVLEGEHSKRGKE